MSIPIRPLEGHEATVQLRPWHDAGMVAGDVLKMLDAALADLKAEAVAVGVIVEDVVEFVCRGRLAGERVDPDTIFYGASVTKQVLGLLLARAVVDRAANADDLVRRWLPELPDWMVAVRLRHLIHHTSDLPDLTLGVPRSNLEVVERFRRQQPGPAPQPGVRYAYNNAGYVLLAEALSRIREQPISDIASAQLFTPLQLTRTTLGGTPVSLATAPDPPGTVGDGGLWTSVTDLTAWLHACNQSRPDVEAQGLAETTGRLADGTHLDYAWGVRIRPTSFGRLITHGGSWQAWLAKTARVPEKRVGVAVLSVGGTEQTVSDIGVHLAEALAYR